MASRKDDPEKMKRMDEWLAAVEEEIGVDADAFEEIKPALLDLIGKIAHGPSRPGAPLSAYLIGYAAGAGNGDASELIARVSKLADEH